MVVMDRKDYIDKANNLLSQPVYNPVERDPTSKLKAKLITLLRNLKKGNRTGGPHIQVPVPNEMCFPKVLWPTKYP